MVVWLVVVQFPALVLSVIIDEFRIFNVDKKYIIDYSIIFIHRTAVIPPVDSVSVTLCLYVGGRERGDEFRQGWGHGWGSVSGMCNR